MKKINILHLYFRNSYLMEFFYDGFEYAKGSMMTKTLYDADVRATYQNGKELVRMDVEMIFPSAFGVHSLPQ